MQKYVIEREVAGAGALSEEELRAMSLRSIAGRVGTQPLAHELQARGELLLDHGSRRGADSVPEDDRRGREAHAAQRLTLVLRARHVALVLHGPGAAQPIADAVEELRRALVEDPRFVESALATRDLGEVRKGAREARAIADLLATRGGSARARRARRAPGRNRRSSRPTRG